MIQRVLMAGSALATMMGAPALAQQVGAPPAPAPTASDEVARVDDIVVTGYRASVAESRDIKRDAAEVVVKQYPILAVSGNRNPMNQSIRSEH